MTSNLIKLLWPQWQERGLGRGQRAPGEESGGQRGWWKLGAGDRRVRGDRGASREEGTSWGWVRAAGQARPAARTAQLPRRPQPQDQGRGGTAGTGPPKSGFPETLAPCRDPTANSALQRPPGTPGDSRNRTSQKRFSRDPRALQRPHCKLSPAETPRHSRHWPQPQEAEGSRETLSVVGD